MSDKHSSEWNRSGWKEEVQPWISTVLAGLGIRQSRPLEMVQERPWSTVVRVPTLSGDLYFKACSPVIAFEPALTQALSRLRPASIPEVLAIDAQMGWMLMTDGGSRAREVFHGGLEVENWSEIVANYATLQIASSSGTDELLSLGVRDRRVPKLPELYGQLLSDREWFLVDQKDGISSSEYELLAMMAGYFEGICDQLAAYNIPAAIHHNDLHDGNIFLKNGHFLFFDWGDSSISHPFFSLRTALVSIEITFGLEERHPIYETLASAYLEAWTRYETKERLAQAFSLARKLWAISSAIKYWTIFSQLEEYRHDYATAVPALVKEFLESNVDWDEKNWASR